MELTSTVEWLGIYAALPLIAYLRFYRRLCFPMADLPVSLGVVLKAVPGIRSWVASITAAAVMFAPWVFLLFCGGSTAADDDWQRGLPLFPIVFLVGVVLCSSVADWLQSIDRVSLRRFTVGASLASCAIALVLLVPSLVIGSFVGVFSFQSAIIPSLAFVSIVGPSAFPGAAVWWLVAGLAHNKSHNKDA